MESQKAIENTDLMFLRAWAVSIVVLVALPWKLWIPGFTSFPRVPVFEATDPAIAVVFQYAAICLLITGLIGLCVSKKLQSSTGAIVLSFGVLFLCNQHCLQPWAWQAFIIAGLLACLPIHVAKIWIGRVLISIYLYSAIGKFDYQFIHSLGQEFLDVVLKLTGQTNSISDQVNSKLVLLFPIGELVIAAGLLIPQTRKLAAWLAIALHVVLIAILSPFGLNHRWPVLVWNAMSILFVCWLFLLPQKTDGLKEGKTHALSFVGVVFAMVVLVGPLLRPVQLWDHWLAWGLYSPSNSRIELFLSDRSRDECSEELQKYFYESADQFGSSEFAIDRWSLDELGVPIYPQARFQKAAAIAWLEQKRFLSQATVIEYGPSHPVTGKRSKAQVDLRDQSFQAYQSN